MGFFSKVTDVVTGVATGGLYPLLKAGMKMAGSDGGAAGTIDEAIAGLSGVKSPTAEELTYKLESLVQQGVMTPEQAQAFLVERTAMEDVSVDPRLKAAQMGALSSLQEIGAEGGLTAIDRAKVEELVSRMGQEERGAREAITQNMAERGISGSGFELASKLASNQGAATRSSQQGTDLAAIAQQRALDAIAQAGQLGGQMRGQEFGEQSSVAQAKDAVAKFNAQHLQSTDATNVAARNAAQDRNLTEKQRIADANAATTGANRQIAADAKQTVFGNEMDRRKAIADMLLGKAQNQREKAQGKAGFVGNLIGTVGQVGGGLIAKSDEESKNVSRETPDMDAFMESIKPLAFEYKDPTSPGAAPGKNVGVTAQDVEKTPVGRTMVQDTPDGKMLDMQKGFSVILAALAALHDKTEDKNPKPPKKPLPSLAERG